MEHLLINRARRMFVFLTLCLLFVQGCSSTAEEDVTVNCPTEISVNCTDDNGDDRGYNPCLVNKKLPVCQK